MKILCDGSLVPLYHTESRHKSTKVFYIHKMFYTFSKIFVIFPKIFPSEFPSSNSMTNLVNVKQFYHVQISVIHFEFSTLQIINSNSTIRWGLSSMFLTHYFYNRLFQSLSRHCSLNFFDWCFQISFSNEMNNTEQIKCDQHWNIVRMFRPI